MERNTSYNEKHLLSLLAKGDETAYRQLYDRYSGKVFSIAFLYLKSHTSSQDIVQEVFLKLWTKRTELTNIENFNGWLHLVTRNTIIDGLRKKVLEEKILLKQNYSEDPGAEQIVIGKETALVIHDAIENLSPRQKEIFRMAREQGLKHQEIGERLGLSPETVKVHMREALRSMRAYLKKNLGMFALFFMHYLK